MKRNLTLLGVVLTLVLSAGLGYAAPGKKAGGKGGAAADAGTKISGVVEVVKDETGEVTAVTLKDTSKDPAVVYSVKLEGKGADLKTMEGQKVDVTGTVAKEGDDNVLTVKSVKAAAAQAEGAKKAEKADDDGEAGEEKCPE
jgi:hypothetical protein